MSAMRLVLAAMTAIVFAACGGDGDDEVETPTETAAETSAAAAPTVPPADGDAILIETRVTDARSHTGEVVAMYIGESAYCRGAKTSGGSDGAAIATTLECPEGTLKLEFAPTQPSNVQGATWEV